MLQTELIPEQTFLTMKRTIPFHSSLFLFSYWQTKSLLVPSSPHNSRCYNRNHHRLSLSFSLLANKISIHCLRRTTWELEGNFTPVQRTSVITVTIAIYLIRITILYIVPASDWVPESIPSFGGQSKALDDTFWWPDDGGRSEKQKKKNKKGTRIMVMTMMNQQPQSSSRRRVEVMSWRWWGGKLKFQS